MLVLTTVLLLGYVQIKYVGILAKKKEILQELLVMTSSHKHNFETEVFFESFLALIKISKIIKVDILFTFCDCEFY